MSPSNPQRPHQKKAQKEKAKKEKGGRGDYPQPPLRSVNGGFSDDRRIHHLHHLHGDEDDLHRHD